VAVTQLTPASAPPGATKVPVLSFTVHTGSLSTEKFKAAKPTFQGTTSADIQTVYLYQELGPVAGSSFDPIADRQWASAAPVGCGAQVTLDPTDFALAANT